MENFRPNLNLWWLLILLCTGCDPIYNTESKTLVWEINKAPTELIQIDAHGNASLRNGTLILDRVPKNQQLLFMITSVFPERSVLDALCGMPLDSLAKNNYIFDTKEKGFYSLGLFDLDKDTIHFRLDRPVVGTHNYLVGIPSDSTLKVQLILGFQKLGDTLRPSANIVSLENK